MLPPWANLPGPTPDGSTKRISNTIGIALLLALLQNKAVLVFQTPVSDGFWLHHSPQLILWLPSILVLDILMLATCYTLTRYTSGTIANLLANGLAVTIFVTTLLNSLVFYTTGSLLHLGFILVTMQHPSEIWGMISDRFLMFLGNMSILIACAYAILRFATYRTWIDTQHYSLLPSDQDVESGNKETVLPNSLLSNCRKYVPAACGSLALYGILVALLRPSFPWNSLSRTPVLSLAVEGLHKLYRTTAHHHGPEKMYAAPKRILPGSPAYLQNRIDHVVVFVLESGREDAVPNPERFVHNIGLRFLEPYKATDVMPFLQNLHQSSWIVPNVTASADYTTKSFSSIIGGVWPANQDHTLVEAHPNSLPYQEPLPKAFNRLAMSRGRRASSAYFSAGKDDFVEYNKVIQKLGFDRYYNYSAIEARHKLDHLEPPLPFGFFGTADDEVLPHFRQWLSSQFEAPGDGVPPLTLATFLTSVTHVPFEIREEYSYRRYVSDDWSNKYLQAWQSTDDYIRNIWNMYNERNLIDNTLFVFLGDHGLALHDEHRKLWGTVGVWTEAAFRVPLFFSNPGLRPGTHQAPSSTNLDVLPSIMDLLINSHPQPPAPSPQANSNLLELSPKQCEMSRLLHAYEGTSVFRTPQPDQPQRVTFSLTNPGDNRPVIGQGDMRLVIDKIDDVVSAYHIGFDPHQLVDLMQDGLEMPDWVYVDEKGPQSGSTILSSANETAMPAPKEVGLRVAEDGRMQVDLWEVKAWAREMAELTRRWAFDIEERWMVGNASVFWEKRMEAYVEPEGCKGVGYNALPA